jgi:DnaJ-class molecular chaperone
VAPTHYETIGISQNATQAEIAGAYHEQAMKWHPDKNGGSAESGEMFKRVVEAYAILREPSTRVSYDASLGGGSDAVGLAQAQARLAAAQRFLQELSTLAAALASKGLPPASIAQALHQKGCPRDIAVEITVSVLRRPVQRPVRAGPREWDLRLHPRNTRGRRRSR